MVDKDWYVQSIYCCMTLTCYSVALTKSISAKTHSTLVFVYQQASSHAPVSKEDSVHPAYPVTSCTSNNYLVMLMTWIKMYPRSNMHCHEDTHRECIDHVSYLPFNDCHSNQLMHKYAFEQHTAVVGAVDQHWDRVYELTGHYCCVCIPTHTNVCVPSAAGKQASHMSSLRSNSAESAVTRTTILLCTTTTYLHLQLPQHTTTVLPSHCFP